MLLLALTSILVMGIFLVLFGLRKPERGWPCLEFLPLSFLVGIFLASYQLFIYYIFGIEFTFGSVIVLPFVMFILLFARYAAHPDHLASLKARGVPVRWSLPEKILAAALAVQVVWVILLVLPMPVHSYDAVANYALKAKMFYLDGGIPTGFFALPEATVAHPGYPPLLPLVMAWIYNVMGLNDLAVNFLMPAVYIAFLTFVYSQLKYIAGRSQALVLTFLLASIPQLADYATIVYADLFLAVFAATGLIYFVRYMTLRERTHLVLSALFMGACLWIKNEGVVWFAAYALALLVFAVRQNEEKKTKVIRDLVPALLVFAVAVLPWIVVRLSASGVNSDINIARLTPARFLENIKDVPMLLNLFQQEVFGPKKWNIFWILFFGSLVWKRKKILRGENSYIALFIITATAGYFAGYMVTTGHNLFFYVNTTISRFMLHFTGVALVMMAYLVKDEALFSFKGKTRGEEGDDKILFLDRDGVINREGDGWTKGGYSTSWEDFSFLPGTFDAFKSLKEAGYRTVIVSNQQCVAKGLMTEEELDTMTEKFTASVEAYGGKIEKVYYCTHLKEDNCGCRKPDTGLFHKAAEELGIKSLKGKFYIGDSERDVQAGQKMEMKTVFVRTGRNRSSDAEGWAHKPDYTCNDLQEAVRLILS